MSASAGSWKCTNQYCPDGKKNLGRSSKGTGYSLKGDMDAASRLLDF
jgi:hypothetical protein